MSFRKATIVVCRCHDKHDQGATTKSGLTEWQIAADINESMTRHLRTDGLAVHRLEGTLPERVRAINDLAWALGHDVYAVEVHCDWSPIISQRGHHVMAYHRSRHSIGVAINVLHELDSYSHYSHGLNLCSQRHRWIGTSREYGHAPRLAFLLDVQCPSIIVECCYLSNPDDARWIEHETNRHIVGHAVAKGISNYITERWNDEQVPIP